MRTLHQLIVISYDPNAGIQPAAYLVRAPQNKKPVAVAVGVRVYNSAGQIEYSGNNFDTCGWVAGGAAVNLSYALDTRISGFACGMSDGQWAPCEAAGAGDFYISWWPRLNPVAAPDRWHLTLTVLVEWIDKNA